MDVYKCCAVCLYIFKLWDNEEVPLLENNYQGMVKINNKNVFMTTFKFSIWQASFFMNMKEKPAGKER